MISLGLSSILILLGITRGRRLSWRLFRVFGTSIANCKRGFGHHEVTPHQCISPFFLLSFLYRLLYLLRSQGENITPSPTLQINTDPPHDITSIQRWQGPIRKSRFNVIPNYIGNLIPLFRIGSSPVDLIMLGPCCSQPRDGGPVAGRVG